jgi:uncharacterized RDD family membrane protein YckC
MEASTGKTVGKYVTGTQVLTEDGEQPSVGTIFIRTLCRIIPFEPFSFFGYNSATRLARQSGQKPALLKPAKTTTTAVA